MNRPLPLLLATTLLAALLLPASAISRDEFLELLLQEAATAQPPERRAVAWWQIWPRRPLADAEWGRRVERLLESQLAQPAIPPGLRRLLRRLQMERAAEKGDATALSAGSEELGFSPEVWILGPLPTSVSTAEAPEAPGEDFFHPGRRFAGPGGEVSWRRLPARAPDGLIELNQLLAPADAAEAWVAARLQVPRRGRALLSAGCAEACVVWLNGARLIDDRGRHAHAFDQHLVPLALEKGSLLLLARLAADSGGWQFSFALSRDTGEGRVAFPVAEEAKPGRTSRAVASLPPRLAGPPLSLSQWFLRQVQEKPNHAQTLAEAAFVLSRSHCGDSRRQQVEQLAEQAAEFLSGRPDAARLALLLAEATSRSEDAIRYLSPAVSHPLFGPEAQAMRGEQRLAGGELEAALEDFRTAAARGSLRAALGLLDALQLAGLEGLAYREAQRLLRQAPETPLKLLAAAQVQNSSGHFQAAQKVFDRLLELDATENTARRASWELALAAGELERALAIQLSLIERYPTHADLWLERSRVLLRNGHPEEALAACLRAEQLRPFDWQPLHLAAEAAEQLGRLAEAERYRDRALALAPEQLPLQRSRQMRQSAPEAAFYRRWQLEPETLATEKEYAAGEGPAEAERLYDATVIRLRPRGLVDRFRQQIIRVNTPAGAERLRRLEVVYAPDHQQLQILSARVLHPAGGSDEQVLVEDLSLSEPWYNLYYDIHSRRLTFLSLAAGDLIELTTLVEDSGDRALLEGYFGELLPLAFGEPTRRSLVALLTPPGHRIFFTAPSYSRYVRETGNGEDIHRWESFNPPVIQDEPAMPGPLAGDMLLHVSHQPDWPALAQWYWSRLQDRLLAGQAVTRLAKQLTVGLSRPEERVRAIYRYVADSIRYVGIEFGLHGVLPAAAEEVLARGFGDCKDKSALLVALLAQAGVTARLALLRTGAAEPLPSSPASLEVFNHAVVYLPQLNWWLDATAPFHDAAQLPALAQGVPALVIQPSSPYLTRTWCSTAADNKNRLRLKLALEEDGSAIADLEIEVTGFLAPGLRQQLAPPSSRHQVLEAFLGELFGQVTLREMEFQDLEVSNRPLRIKASLEFSALAERDEAGRLWLPALGLGTRYQGLFAPLPGRRHALVTGPPWSMSWQISLKFPSGFSLVSPPAPGRMESDFGQAFLSGKLAGDRWQTHAAFVLEQGLVPVERYGEFREFLRAVDSLFGARLCLGREKRTSAP